MHANHTHQSVGRRGANPAPHLLFVVNSDWFFLSHRLPLARRAREEGFTVSVATNDSGKARLIRDEGFRFIPLSISRRGMNPLVEVRTLLQLRSLYARLRPDLVHHVTPKPILYGSIAARGGGGPGVVNAVSGLGYIFSGGSWTRPLRPLVSAMYRIALRLPRSRTIFQNPDDYRMFVTAGLIGEAQAVLIRGSGVDCERFRPTPQPSGVPVVMLASRMLWDKGIGEFVEAARCLRQSHPDVRFVLVGAPDPGNPASVPEARLSDWANEGVIEWWGHREDMPAVLAQAAVVALPSYREGLPKVLLEAAACQRPLVGSNVPGCREIVRHGVNGLLVTARRSDELARAIARLIDAPEWRKRLGQASRELVLREFADEIVVDRTFEVYRELLGQSAVRSLRREAAGDFTLASAR